MAALASSANLTASPVTGKEEWRTQCTIRWQGLCLLDFHDKFPIQWKRVKRGKQKGRSASLCVYLQTGFSEKEKSLIGNLGEWYNFSPNIGLHKLHEGAAQPNGGLADTLVYGNRHRGSDIWALIFFLYDGGGTREDLCVKKRDIILRLIRSKKNRRASAFCLFPLKIQIFVCDLADQQLDRLTLASQSANVASFFWCDANSTITIGHQPFDRRKIYSLACGKIVSSIIHHSACQSIQTRFKNIDLFLGSWLNILYCIELAVYMLSRWANWLT